ncbi:DUF5133 domain-containing protein [Streptomyces sp. NPDC047108]|uniref:DUF5133 domain-containing protein n=1 Tax=Streptomyces sp. NPDC047108 TaxID=3155025 RepID=UPI0033CF2A15
MLMAHPAVLTDLVAQYEALEALRAHEGVPEAQQRLDDVVRNLCVATGAPDVEAALVVARQQLREERARSGTLVAG